MPLLILFWCRAVNFPFCRKVNPDVARQRVVSPSKDKKHCSRVRREADDKQFESACIDKPLPIVLDVADRLGHEVIQLRVSWTSHLCAFRGNIHPASISSSQIIEVIILL